MPTLDRVSRHAAARAILDDEISLELLVTHFLNCRAPTAKTRLILALTQLSGRNPDELRQDRQLPPRP